MSSSVVVKVEVEIRLRVEKEDGALVGKKKSAYMRSLARVVKVCRTSNGLVQKNNEHPTRSDRFVLTSNTTTINDLDNWMMTTVVNVER